MYGFSLNSSFKALIYLDFISFVLAMALPLRFRRRPRRPNDVACCCYCASIVFQVDPPTVCVLFRIDAGGSVSQPIGCTPFFNINEISQGNSNFIEKACCKNNLNTLLQKCS